MVSSFESKKFQIKIIYVIFRERFPHPDKYSWGISYKYFPGWRELTKEEINRYCLCHTFFRNFLSCLYHKQKCLDSCFLQLIFLLRDLFLLLIQQSLFKTLLNVQRVSLGCILVGSSLIPEKRKLAKRTTRCLSLSFVFTRCHLLLVVVSRCLSLHQSLSLVAPLVVTRCITRLSFYKRYLKSKYLSSIRVFPFFISFFC